MATIGRPMSSAIALARPMVEPPTSATTPSAPSDVAYAHALCAPSPGTCMRAPSTTPTQRSPTTAAAAWATVDSCGVHSTSARSTPNAATSSVRRARLPGANTTRAGDALLTKSRMVRDLARHVVDLIARHPQALEFAPDAQMLGVLGIGRECLRRFELGVQNHVAGVVDAAYVQADFQCQQTRNQRAQAFELLLDLLARGAPRLGRVARDLPHDHMLDHGVSPPCAPGSARSRSPGSRTACRASGHRGPARPRGEPSRPPGTNARRTRHPSPGTGRRRGTRGSRGFHSPAR